MQTLEGHYRVILRKSFKNDTIRLDMTNTNVLRCIPFNLKDLLIARPNELDQWH
jgi:hypothetical protein